MELMGAGAAAFNLINQFVTSQIISGEADSEAAALYVLFDPFVQLGLIGVSTELDGATGLVDYTITFPTDQYVNATYQIILGSLFGNPNNNDIEGLIGVIGDSLIDGAYYLGPDGNYIQVNNLYAGLAAQNFYTNLNQYNASGTYSDASIDFTVFQNYPELIEFASSTVDQT